METIFISGDDLTPDQVALAGVGGITFALSSQARQHIAASRKIVDLIVKEERVVYGINTGFGKFSDRIISNGDVKLLQKNLLMTQAVGAGPNLEKEEVRAMMLLRINNLAKGFSGVKTETVDTLLAMLNKGVTPVVPQKGSLGASGDLVPLAHMALPVIGLGLAEYRGEVCSGAEAMKRAGISPVILTEKEGLALINGTQAMTAVGSLALNEALMLLKVADIALALSFEAHNSITDVLDERMHAVRPHKGQMDTARIVKRLLAGSRNTTRQGEIRTQDAYSLRCAPQVHGASKDALNYIYDKVLIEINSVTDNPIIFADTGEGISGGNFHGQPMALCFDFLAIAIAEIAGISERRIERMVNPMLSELPAFLTEQGGLNSGYMILQYTAAALVSENKILAHPASVDSIPSSASQEDHVSMGTIAACKARTVVRNTRRVLALELMTACQAIDLRGDKGMGEGTVAAYQAIRKAVAQLKEDRPLYDDINACEALIADGTLIQCVEKRMGENIF
ncbi:MAG: histidine ammonia-lyase [Tannerellaceae bacterium]|jgi:histidine ammonia-lyase|nr:histidine ammonia-lyase [Tannerellaceae bacterium]